MRRAWRWYWSTVREGWARKNPAQRRITAVVLAASFAFSSVLAAVIAFAPGARVPVLLAVVVLLPLENILMAVLRSRGKRGRSN